MFFPRVYKMFRHWLFALFCYQIWVLSYGVELVANKIVVDYPLTFVAILYQWTYRVE